MNGYLSNSKQNVFYNGSFSETKLSGGADRLVLHYSFQANVIDMHRTLSRLLVKDKLHLRMLVYFYKVIKYHTPCFFSEKLVNVGFRHDFGTCQASKAQLFLACPHHT